MCCSVLQCSVLQQLCTARLSIEMVLQCVAVCCSVLHCVAVCCIVLHCVAVCMSWMPVKRDCCSMWQSIALCCGMLQHVAVCCSVLQCVHELRASCLSQKIVLQSVAVSNSVLQRLVCPASHPVSPKKRNRKANNPLKIGLIC